MTRWIRLGVLSFLALSAACDQTESSRLELSWKGTRERPWPGPDLWANRLQDWRVRDGRLSAVTSLPMRTAHILTRRLAPEEGGVRVVLGMGLFFADGEHDGSREAEEMSAAGVLLGAGGQDLDYRRAALIHHSPGPGGGLLLGVDEKGHLVVRDFSNGNEIIARSDGALSDTDSVEIRIHLVQADTQESGSGLGLQNRILLEGRSFGPTPSELALDLPSVSTQLVTGGLALVSHTPDPGGPRAGFFEVSVDGPGIEVHRDRSLGPILGAQHTLSRGVLTLSAQLLPIGPIEEGPGVESADSVLLEYKEDDQWIPAGYSPVIIPGYTSAFRIEEWDSGRALPYRLTLKARPGEGPFQPLHGSVRPEPKGDGELVVAAFTGNHNVASPGVDRGAFNWKEDLWFPHDDIVEHVWAQDPDFLFFSGDQVYEGASPTRADLDHPWGDYLYKWYLWLWAFRDLTSEIPSVAIPDDHDVFHGNVWGAGGRSTPPGLTGAEAQDQGGYKLPPDWVNMVQRTQTAQLPPPWDPSPSMEGIEAYFTDILYGGVSFAVLEDRKFKSPPKLLLPEADVWNGWAQNPGFDAPAHADVPGASLLGAAQESFLEEWAHDWSDGTWMKVVLSQTIFGNVATIPSGALNGSVIPGLPIPEPGAYVPGDKMAADMDSNGWPPSGRDRALRAMRKGFAVHLAGDQHLASTIQYGLDEYGDGPFALCVPSVANFWPRRWYPPEPGKNRGSDDPLYAGDFADGFGNLMTVFAVSNPAQWGREPTVLHNRAPGYGIARFNRSTREVTLEAWPRWSNPEVGDTPYPGWPVRFQQVDGYGGRPFGFLPTLDVKGESEPVVQVLSELGGEILYTYRVRGNRFTPPVFGSGSYTITVGEPGRGPTRTFLGLQPTPDSSRVLEVVFDGSG